METTTLLVSVSLDAAPDAVFRTLTDSTLHSAFTGSRSEIDASPGGRFSYFDGAITGAFEAVDPPHRLVQTLRAGSWPPDSIATVTSTLASAASGARTQVTVVEAGFPSGHRDDVVAGWSGYWDALEQFLRNRKLAVVKRFVDEYKNRQNPDIVDDLVAEDCRVHIPLPGLPQGREGMRLNGQMMCGAFPDVHVEREFFVTEGDIVIERAHAKATHLGEIMGTAPTRRPVTWTELHAYRVSGDEITEVWSEADFMGVMVQIGAVQLPSQ